MLDMKITITAADLTAALNNLASALTSNAKPTEKPAASVAQPAPIVPPQNATSVTDAPVENPTMQISGAPLSATPAQTTTPIAPTIPVAAPAPAATPAANATQASTVPTSAPQYTLEMIATAGSALIDAGKMNQLMQLLGKFGVASLTELAPENYGAVAHELRAMGASI